MRRPLPFIWFSIATGIFTVEYFKNPFFIFIAIASLLFLLAPKKSCYVVLIISLLSGQVIMIYSMSKFDFPDELLDKEVTLKGRIIAATKKDGYSQLRLKGKIINTNTKPSANPNLNIKNNNETILLSVTGDENPDELIEKTVIFKGVVKQPSGAKNPGGFDYARYLKSQGIRMSVSGKFENLVADDNIVSVKQAAPTNSFNHTKSKNLSVMRCNTTNTKNTSLKQAAPFDSNTSVTPKTNALSLPAIRLSLASARTNFKENICEKLGDEQGGMMMGMLFGDKSLLSDDVYELFKRNGTAHLLAVSGIHVGILYVCLNKILAFMPRLGRFFLLLICLLTYAWLCQFSPSVVRAALMISTHMFATLFKRRYDFLSGISFAGILLLLYNPYNLFHPGYQLSFMAVLLLAFSIPFAESKINKYISNENAQSVAKYTLPLFVIQSGMMPLVAFQFCFISFSAFIVNFPVIALAGWLIPLGMCAFMISAASGCLIEIFIIAMEKLGVLMLFLNEMAASSDFAATNSPAPPLCFLFLFYMSLFGLSSEAFYMRMREKNRRFLIACLLIILLTASFIYIIFDKEKYDPKLVFLDVGQGDCMHLRLKNGQNILIDGGGSEDFSIGKKILLPYLLKNGVSKLDLVIVSHLHQDHYGGIKEVSDDIKIKKLAIFSGHVDKKDEFIKIADEVLFLHKGNKLKLKDCEIEILYPDKNTKISEDENNNCLVAQIDFDGLKILATGDIYEEIEKNLDLEDVDVLKVAHHGSAYSTGDNFLQKTKPEIAVIQVGRNLYGHPSRKVIEKLKANDIITHRTDRSHAVIIRKNLDGKFIIKTMKEKQDEKKPL